MRSLTRPLRLSAFAAVVLVPLLQLYSYGAQRSEWQTDLYWNAIFAAQGAGLEIALPAAGAFVAYRASFERAFLVRPISGVGRSWVRRFWRASWPSGCGLTIGTVVTFYFTLNASGVPAVAFNASILIAFLGMCCTAIAASYVLGRLLPPRASVVIAILVNYEWQLYPQLDGIAPWIRNISGFTLWDSAFTPYLETAPGAILAPALVGAGVLLALALIMPRWIARPHLLGSVAAAITVAIAVGVACVAVIPVDPRAYQARPASVLQCEGRQPTICLLPEQQHLAGATTRGAIKMTWKRAMSAGVELPSTVQSVYYGFANPASQSRTNYVLLEQLPTARGVQLAYLSSVVHSYDCNSDLVSAADESRDEGAIVALAQMVHVAPRAALEDYAGAGEGETTAVKTIINTFRLTSTSASADYLRTFFEHRVSECKDSHR